MSAFTDWRDAQEDKILGSLMAANPAEKALPATSARPASFSSITSSAYFVPAIIIIVLAVVLFGFGRKG